MPLTPPTRPVLIVACVLAALFAALTPAAPARAAASEPEPARGWVWPLQPQPDVLTVFDAPDGPYGPGHRGVDLAGAIGQPVLAVAGGEVSFAGQVAGRGVVVVDHGRLRTTYEPVLPLVRRGDAVAGGQTIGTLGVVGSHCVPAACLHLGVREGDVYLDPLQFLPSGPIRLLPLSVPLMLPFGALFGAFP